MPAPGHPSQDHPANGSRSSDYRERTLSLLRATLESTADGLLVVDTAGRVASYNSRFVELWQIPPALVDKGNDEELVAFVLGQLADPAAFAAKVQHLYHHPAETSFDVLTFTRCRARSMTRSAHFCRSLLPVTRSPRRLASCWRSQSKQTEKKPAIAAARLA